MKEIADRFWLRRTTLRGGLGAAQSESSERLFIDLQFHIEHDVSLFRSQMMQEPPIQSPKNQQAHDAIKGYNYQSWLTVEAWLELGDDDLLYVEAAEDFATFSGNNTAKLGQAKATVAALTLRSGDAIEALNHFWAFHQQGSGYKIRYSFISTSPIGAEQGNPFDGTKGISLWQSASTCRNISKAKLLLDFLIQDKVSKKLDASLLAYLQTTSPEDFLKEVICSIVWDLKNGGIDDVKATVRSQLGIIAERKYGFPSAHASNLSDTLFTAISDIAASKEKVALTSASLDDFLQNHLKAVKTSVNSVRSLDAFAGTLAGASGLDVGWHLTDVTPAIELSEDFSLREPAIKALTSQIDSAQFVMVEGSSGMGKSVLAVLYAKSLKMDCMQFRSRGTELPRILRGLQECLWLIANNTDGVVVIIDDLPWSSLDAGGINILLGLSRTARKKGTQIVFTNQRAASQRELSTTGFNDLVAFKAPLMTEDEIIDLALRLGCPDSDLAKSWTPIVKLQASGHPQLVHAYLIGLKRLLWPQISGDSFLAGSQSVREEQKHTLLKLIDDREIELLTRLSAYYGTFRKEHAIAMAESLERIVGSTVAFEHLIGPWVEPLSDNRYQITPIIGRTLLNDLPKSRKDCMHIGVVDSIIACQPLEMQDAASALINAIEGNASAHASGLIMQFLTAPDEHTNALFTYLSWVQFIKSDGGIVFEGYPALDYIFRVLQFRVCSQNAPDKCEDFLKLCDKITESDTAGIGEVRLHSILAASIISSDVKSISFSRLYWANDVIASSMATMVEELENPLYEDDELGLHFNSREDECDFMFVAKTWQKASSFGGLKDLLDFLRFRSVDGEVFSRDLSKLTKNKALVLSAFDQVWLQESKQAEPEWNPTLSLFSEYMEQGQRWGCDIFTVCAAHCISVIHDEYLKDSESAAKVLEGLSSDDPEVQSIIAEQKGKILLSQENYQEAQIHFETSIAHNPWKVFTSSSVLIAYYNAGYSAAKAGDWQSSANHFWTAHELAREDHSWTRAVAFAADAGYSYWEFGSKETAIDCFEAALSMVSKMPPHSSDLLSLKVQKMLGNMLLQLNWSDDKDTPNREVSAPISPGMCSNLETIEALKDLPPPILNFEWAFLMNIEFEHSSSSKIWDKYSDPLLKEAHPGLKFLVLSLKARKCLQESNESALMEVGIGLSHSIASSAKFPSSNDVSDYSQWGDLRTEESPGSIALDSPYPINFLLMCGVSNAALRGDDPIALIETWQTGSTIEGISIVALDEWLSTVSSSYSQDLLGALKTTSQADTLWERWSAALKLLSSDAKHDPMTLLAASMALLLYGWHNSSNLEVTDDIYATIDNKLSQLWKKACENRYAFRSPTLYVPDIRELACNPEGTSRHIARLILAAYPATDLNLPKAVLDQVKELL